MINKLAASELVLNDDGSVYHLNLLPEDIAGKIMLVGDPDRVPKVSKYFDKIEIKKYVLSPSVQKELFFKLREEYPQYTIDYLYDPYKLFMTL